MKQIISLIKTNHSFKKFQTSMHIDLIKKSLPDTLKKYLRYTHMKNTTLFFMFDNPAIITEFEHKKNSIKFIIKKIEEVHKINLNISEIVAMSPSRLSNQRLVKSKHKPSKKVFQERSLGEYSNNLSNQDLFDKMENIRQIIKENH